MRPSYANVTSSLALFLALSGTSYAVATTLPKNSVGDKQLRPDAVTGAKIKDGTVGGADLAPGVAASGPRGPRGEQGPAGERGPSDVFVGTGGVKSFPTSANAHVVVAKLTGLPAGSYVFEGNARISNWYSGLGGALCALYVNGTDVGSGYLPLGGNAGSVASGPIRPQGHATVAAGANATFECWFDNTITTSATIEQPRLTAWRVANLTEQKLP